MDGEYQAYPEYEKTDINWVEKLPKHWELNKLRYMFSFGKGLTITKANLVDEGVPCVNYGEVHSRYGFEVDPEKHYLKCVSEEYLKSSPSALLSKGDFVFADTSEDIEGSGNFTQLVSNEVVFAGYHTVIARPIDKESSRFYAYLLDSVELRTQVRHAVKGVKVFSITQAILRAINVWLPPVDERQKIANFLDYETAKIDTLIEKQQQLIKLLKEKRQAVISHAVTKGLNPDVPMRDSGIEWFDLIPEHWKILELKFVAKDGYKTFTDGDWIESPYITDSGVRLLQTGNVGIGEFKEKGFRYVSSNTFKKLSCTEVKPNDVLICRLDGPVGRSCLAPDLGVKVITSVDNAILKPSEDFDPRFIVYLTNCTPWLDWVADLCRVGGGFRLRVSRTMLGDQRIQAPPIGEQKLIADKLDALSDHSLKCMERCEEGILLLRERRTALISAAVTGKIDVRNWEPAEC